jgi:hypothetical protein
MLPARMNSGADWIGDDREHDRDGAGRLQQWHYGPARLRQDDIGRECDELRCGATQVVGIGAGKAMVDPHVMADGPTRLLEALRECCKTGLRFGIVRRDRHERADAPHALALLRPRRERPGREAADERDEIATLAQRVRLACRALRVSRRDRPGPWGRPELF